MEGPHLYFTITTKSEQGLHPLDRRRSRRRVPRLALLFPPEPHDPQAHLRARGEGSLDRARKAQRQLEESGCDDGQREEHVQGHGRDFHPGFVHLPFFPSRTSRSLLNDS